MKAMVVKRDGGSSSLELREIKIPEMKDNEVMIKVFACGVNRGDVIDLVTKEDGACPGLECSGMIDAVGRNVHRWEVGERVCAILDGGGGGGYAEKVCVPENFLLPLPDDIDLYDAATLPYASCCIWLALYKTGFIPDTHEAHLKNKKILIRHGTSGIGALAIQYAKLLGLRVFTSTESSGKFSECLVHGADEDCFDSTFSADEVVHRDERGVDIVLDDGGSDLQRNIECCRLEGKVCIVDLQGKVSNSIDVAMLQKKQAGVKVLDVRYRDSGYKASVIAGVRTDLWPAVLNNKVVPSVGNRRFVLTEAQKALNLLKENYNIGKIIVHMHFEKTRVENRRFVLTEAQKTLKLLKKNDNIAKIIAHMNFEKASHHLKME